MKLTTKELTLSALCAAICAIFSTITIPASPVPFTLGVFGVLLVSSAFGARIGTLSSLIFILVGAVGLPVFSNFQGGVGVLLSPTGGYIASYIPMAFVAGMAADRNKHGKRQFLSSLSGCFLSLIICYCLGTLWFMLTTGKSAGEAFLLCVLPFIGFDALKCAFAAFLGIQIKKRMK